MVCMCIVYCDVLGTPNRKDRKKKGGQLVFFFLYFTLLFFTLLYFSCSNCVIWKGDGWMDEWMDG